MSEVAFEKPSTEIEAEIPVKPIGWRVLVRPYKAPSTYGESQIHIADEALESEQLLTYVGQIVAMGDQCFKAVTRSGIELSKIEPKPKVGDWIMYGTYGGQTIKTKSGAKYLIMNDDGIMGIVSDPSSFRAYL
jgi:co-chaperonin GroES (HSP10)